MIHVKRSLKPNILKKNAIQWRRDISSASNSGDSNALKKAINKYQHEEIKTALRKMFHDKCAYCESKITHVDYGHIEHFKPKTLFPQLAVSWDNLLLGCAICNGSGYKGVKFPDSKQGGPIVNPCRESPEDLFEFEYDQRVRSANVLGKTVRSATTVNVLGLNRESLRQQRSILVRSLIALAKYYHSDAEARSLLDEAVENTGEYAAFARMVKKRFVKKSIQA